MGSYPLLATKLFVPTRRSQVVARPRVAGRLDPTLEPGHRLTLVSAPAGFGKTTLLSDWLSDLDRRHVGVGWLSLDDGDNDLARFAAHLAAALQHAGLDVDAAALESLTTAPASVALIPIVNQVAQASEHEPAKQWVLVLDDYHLIEASVVHEALGFLLDQLPEQLHLVLATRSDPPLSLARLRSRGQLSEVRAAELRFSTHEARDFLNAGMGLGLTAADVDALADRTEGWVAGLQLAALSLRDIPDPDHVAGFISAFTGSNRFVLDYLADEVLARQPPPVRTFLQCTAVLERMCGSLCDAVTGDSEGARTLADLERTNLFVVPLDTERSWYRYHHLFADVLQARLLAEHPEQVPGLHTRASAWFAAHGMVADAVRHALAADDPDRAAYLMEEALAGVRRTRQDRLLLTWVRSLPDPVVRRRPVLSIVAAWAALMSGDLDAVEPRLDDVEAALAAGAQDPDLAATWADTEDLRTAPATISVYRASLAQARGDVAGTVQHARHALDLAGPEDHVVRGAGGGFLGLAAYAAGNITEALTTFTDAVRSLHAAGNLVDELDTTVVLADMWVAAGRPDRARRLLEQALHTATAGGPPFPRATADLHVGLAELDREIDDLTSAEAHLETARVLKERVSITENQHRWFVVMAQVRAARGDHDGAIDLLDQAEAAYRRGFYPDVRPIAAMKARVQIAAGDLAAASGWAEDRGLSVHDQPEHLREYEHLTLVRLLLAQHEAGGAVLELLDRLHAAATAAGRGGSVREIRMLQQAARAEPADRLSDPLSHRELEVLRLLDSELTGPQIARALYVTLNTLRTHTKRIFTKLDVTTRAAAVRRAHERGLL